MPELHLLRLPIDPAGLVRLARAQNIPISDEDHGYAIHALLKALFTSHAPAPWWFDARRSIVWAYSMAPVDELERRSANDPLPINRDLARAAVRWDAGNGRHSKLVPALAAGLRAAFDLRACPVVRFGVPRADDARRRARPDLVKKRAQECDYLLWRARCDDVAPDTFEPEVIYGEWLRARAWKADAGARLMSGPEGLAVSGWSKPMMTGANAWRGRGDGSLRLPDVTYTGVLEIIDPSMFLRTLARGIGRHRAFGFGMLRLRPVA